MRTCRDMCFSSRIAMVALVVFSAIAPGCGKIGSPLPPEPRGPRAPTRVAVRQTGNQARILFTQPAPRGAHPSQVPATAELVRVTYGVGQAANLDAAAFARRSEIVARLSLSADAEGSRLILVDGEWPRQGTDPEGWTLRYGVRVRDVRGRPSPLVLANDLLVVSEMGAPDELAARATADGISLNWQAPGEGAGALYHVYRKTRDECCWPESPVHVGVLEQPEFLDRGVKTGEVYRYTVRTAQDDETPLRESLGSGTIEVLARDLFPPARPEGLVAVQEGRGIRLFWDPSEARDLAGYRLFRRVDGNEWHTVGDAILKRALYLDSEVEIGQKVEYRTSAVDRADPPNESPFSEIVEVEIGDQFE